MWARALGAQPELQPEAPSQVQRPALPPHPCLPTAEVERPVRRSCRDPWLGGAETLSEGSESQQQPRGYKASLLLTPLPPKLPPTHPPPTSLVSLQSAAKMIKETMDKKFGSSWHVVIGEGFGFEITHEVKNLLYLYFGGTLAVCVWKCS